MKLQDKLWEPTVFLCVFVREIHKSKPTKWRMEPLIFKKSLTESWNYLFGSTLRFSCATPLCAHLFNTAVLLYAAECALINQPPGRNFISRRNIAALKRRHQPLQGTVEVQHQRGSVNKDTKDMEERNDDSSLQMSTEQSTPGGNSLILEHSNAAFCVRMAWGGEIPFLFTV